VADWVNDDQPYVMNVDDREIVSIPYPFELNDSAALLRNKLPMTEFERMIKDAFDVLYREGAESGRVMAISLHPFVIGQPVCTEKLNPRVVMVKSAQDGVRTYET
jgi:hypothetical protein